MTKIVSLTGKELPQPDLVDPKVVAVLERWLKMAKEGDLQGVSLSGLHRNGDVGSAWAGTLSILMLGALNLLMFKLSGVLTENDTDET